jgi:hypothetical protein
VSIDLGPVRLEREFAAGQQEKENPLFGQGIE